MEKPTSTQLPISLLSILHAKNTDMPMLCLLVITNWRRVCALVSLSNLAKNKVTSAYFDCPDGNLDEPVNESNQEAEDDQAVLAHLERRVLDGKLVTIGELRDVLRRAAALLCRSDKDQCAILLHLVGIPFAIFTKQSIKLGISLWLGVINENARREPKIVAAIAENWEKTIRKRIGVFSNKLQ